MKRLLIVLLLLGLVAPAVIAQPSKAGDRLRRKGKLEAAIRAYHKEFQKAPDNQRNTYNLACAYALTYQVDSAYKYLKLALANDPSLWALADTDLLALTDDPRWATIEQNQLARYAKEHGALAEPEYARQLLRIIMHDQALDYFVDQAKIYYAKKGHLPHWYPPLGAMKQQLSQDNFGALQVLLAQYGWPKYSTVGRLAADAPLLVINHHVEDSVRVHYLDRIREACLAQEGSCMEYAKIHDRILVNTDKPQLYGMQFQFNAARKLEPFPIQDPEYVDQRRKEIGLEPLAVYLKRKINCRWTVPQKDK